MSYAGSKEFRPALIVVDMQEDFCPPKPLGVNGARELLPRINEIINYPGFVFRVATQDFHPTNHVSFALNHLPPNNIPFKSYIDMKDPAAPTSVETPKMIPQLLWPVHCVQDTPGVELLSGLDRDKIDLVVQKGMDSRVEMYSAFADAFGNRDCASTGGASADLEAALKEKGVTDVFVVGVAGEYCVKHTAIDSASRGFRTYVVDEATRSVDPERGWDAAKAEIAHSGAQIVHFDGPELEKVRTLT